MSRRRDAQAQTRVWVRDVVRSGLLGPDEEYAEIVAVIRTDHPALDAEVTAREWISAERDAWAADSAHWSRPTGHERLVAAFDDMRAAGLLVLEGCVDHWVVRDALRSRPEARGAAWFTPRDVWHAIDEPMLEVNLWHPDTANVAPGDPLLDEVLGLLRRHGLPARFDEGRVEVATRWQRAPFGQEE